MYARHYDRLLRWARRRYGPDAADLVQEVMERAWRRRGDLDLERDAWHWLTKVARNLAVDQARRAARIVVVDPSALPDTAEYRDPSGEVVARDELAVLARFLRDVDPLDRQLLLAHARGTSAAELAARYGMSVAAVRQRIFRARQRLRRSSGLSGIVIWPAFRQPRRAAAAALLTGATAISLQVVDNRCAPFLRDVDRALETGSSIDAAEAAELRARYPGIPFHTLSNRVEGRPATGRVFGVDLEGTDCRLG